MENWKENFPSKTIPPKVGELEGEEFWFIHAFSFFN